MDGRELEPPYAAITSLPYLILWIDPVPSQERGRKTKVTNNSWQRGPSGLILKKWKVDFEENIEPQNVQQVWVILPGIPMMFWKKEILEAIGGKIGKFIAMEENWEQKIDKICTKILIEVNLRHRLFKEIDSWKIMEEKFGLLEDSIQCFSCRQVGHIARDCLNPERIQVQYKNPWVEKDV